MSARAAAVTRRLRGWAWIWSLAGGAVAYLATAVLQQRLSWEALVTNLGLAGFLVVVGLGQMLVITGGAGGIDLSVSGMVTLAAILQATVAHGRDGAAMLAGVGAALGAGLLLGAVNGALVVGLRLPAMVATLATGFMLDSLIQLYYGVGQGGAPSPALARWVHGSLLGLPDMLWLSLLLTALAGLLLQHTRYGRHLEAGGQSEAAAELTGIRVGRVRFLSYVLSSLAASLGGVLLGAYAGGAFLGMGSPYQLGSIAAVVLGGSLIAGGRSTALGVFGGAVLLRFLETGMQATGLSAGARNVLEGAMIILVLALRRAG
ncbi:MAG: ABC transporter permease [Firmicutes bacterium]|nr:ABC transporter permease [Bacillota bacterium]